MKIPLSCSLATLALAGICAFSAAGQEQTAPKLRIGTYDNRAIAIAYAPSKHNPVSEKMKEHEEAKAAGDERCVQELEAWGEAHQRQLHRQGFAHVPVSDLLAHVAEQLPELAERLDLVAIAAECDWLRADAERVDVTMDLVKLFDPSEKTLATAREILTHAAVDLDELENHKDH